MGFLVILCVLLEEVVRSIQEELTEIYGGREGVCGAQFLWLLATRNTCGHLHA